MFKSKRYVVKFLRNRIQRSDVWFDRFDRSDVKYFFEMVVKLNPEDEEDMHHQEMNFVYYLLGVGYIEDPEQVENNYNASFRLTLKGYEYSQTNIFERHPQFTGIILGAGMSFAFAIAKTIIDKTIFLK